MTTDPRVDAYIAKAAPFARPILQHIRAAVREALPEAAETIKWSLPHWTHAGRIVAAMAAFKAHCAVMIHGDGRQDDGAQKQALGGFGKIASIEQLPPREDLIVKLRAAAARVEATGRASPPRARKAPKPEIAMPDDFAASLAATPGARESFDAFPPSARREYLEWIVSAKRPETRSRRIATAAAQSAEGKRMNWKYENC